MYKKVMNQLHLLCVSHEYHYYLHTCENRLDEFQYRTQWIHNLPSARRRVRTTGERGMRWSKLEYELLSRLIVHLEQQMKTVLKCVCVCACVCVCIIRLGGFIRMYVWVHVGHIHTYIHTHALQCLMLWDALVMSELYIHLLMLHVYLNQLQLLLCH